MNLLEPAEAFHVVADEDMSRFLLRKGEQMKFHDEGRSTLQLAEWQVLVIPSHHTIGGGERHEGTSQDGATATGTVSTR